LNEIKDDITLKHKTGWDGRGKRIRNDSFSFLEIEVVDSTCQFKRIKPGSTTSPVP
jgi:hypothetical protein